MKTIFLSLLALGAATVLRAAAPEVAGGPSDKPGPFLRVATVQMRSVADWRANVAKIKGFLADCAARKVQILAIPECAVSSYDAAAIKALTAEDIATAEKAIAAACREHGIAAVIGIPELREGKLYNCALVIDAHGEIVTRYDKAQLVGQDRAWQCTPGSAPSAVFSIGPTRAAVVVCHDSRFPELSRLPVLAGARVIFYISSEAMILKERKMVPYRAQVQAIAVENTVYVVHANPPADGLQTGSHGQSRIVAPDGNIVEEASQLQEEVLVADLDLSRATGEYALESLQGPLAAWWREGLKQVKVLP
ncbi:MAG TPA: carbon-nitrogen hydrolase family protein [Lacunisphaera sp.]|nr:carbon-nitrogen hydrolase family protein [Lacunisphaera sp.]